MFNLLYISFQIHIGFYISQKKKSKKMAWNCLFIMVVIIWFFLLHFSVCLTFITLLSLIYILCPFSISPHLIYAVKPFPFQMQILQFVVLYIFFWFNFQIQHPRSRLNRFDLVITPQHDYYPLTPHGQRQIPWFLRRWITPRRPPDRHVVCISVVNNEKASWHRSIFDGC